jgi:hypothetical protein
MGFKLPPVFRQLTLVTVIALGGACFGLVVKF